MVDFNDTSLYRQLFKREESIYPSSKGGLLKPMPKVQILCGKNSGLPFDCLMTDIMSGCLSVDKICYGNCTAAEYWIKQGYDFGKKTLNAFNETNFRKSIQKLPPNQKWLRQGWMSDCSFTNESWNLTALISDILNEYGISLLIITKAYTMPSKKTLKTLAKNNAEIRTSVSAFDLPKEIDKRLRLLEDYRQSDGISVPYVMTARYAVNDLVVNQNRIAEYVVNNDYIAGEHPLRFDNNNKILSVLLPDGFQHPKFNNQYWFGRILYNIPNFILPAPTHLSENYTLRFKRFSDLKDGIKIEGIQGNLPTFEQLTQNTQQYSEGLFKHATYIIQKT